MVEPVQQQLELFTTPVGLVAAVVLGLLWGSFANVCIYRWPPTDEHPNGRSVVRPGSHCSACKAPIAWYDNVPLLSYLWLLGRCRACKVRFSPRYLLVEGLTGALFGVAWWFTLGTGGLYDALPVRALWFVVDAAFVFVMVVTTFIDLDHKLILDKIMIPSAVLFYAATFVLPGYRWWDGLVGIAVGWGLPWLVGEIWFRIKKTEGLGLGDGMLLAVVGALLGWRGVIVALLGGSLTGAAVTLRALVSPTRAALAAGAIAAIVAAWLFGGVAAAGAVLCAALLALLLSLRTMDDARELLVTEVPFGPFLAMAAVFYLFAAPWIQLHFRLYL